MRNLHTVVNIPQLVRGIMTNKCKQSVLSKAGSFKHSKTTSIFFVFNLSPTVTGKTSSFTTEGSIWRFLILAVPLKSYTGARFVWSDGLLSCLVVYMSLIISKKKKKKKKKWSWSKRDLLKTFHVWAKKDIWHQLFYNSISVIKDIAKAANENQQKQSAQCTSLTGNSLKPATWESPLDTSVLDLTWVNQTADLPPVSCYL